MEGRKKRAMSIKLVSSPVFADSVIKGFEKDEFQIRYGMTQIIGS